MPKKKTHESFPEYVDWLDKKGKIIGKIDKNFAHAHGVLHPAVHIFVFDSSGKLILQYRAGTKKIYPHYWDCSVGGHVHAGEDLHASAMRELREELGIKTSIQYLGFVDVSGKEKKYHHVERVHYYWTHFGRRMKIKPNEEFEDIAYISPEKMSVFIRTHPFTPMFTNGWKKFRKQISRTLGVKN